MAHTWLLGGVTWQPRHSAGGGARDKIIAGATCHGDEREWAQKKEKVLDLVHTKSAVGCEGLADDREEKWWRIWVDGEIVVPVVLW